MEKRIKEPKIGDKIFVKDFGWLKVKERGLFERGTNGKVAYPTKGYTISLPPLGYSTFEDEDGNDLTFNYFGETVIMRFYDSLVNENNIIYS